MDGEGYGIYLNIGTLTALVAAIVAGVLRARGVERVARDTGHEPDRELRLYVEAQLENLTRELAQQERDNIIRFDTVRRETGEVGAALRQRIHDMDIQSRDRMDQAMLRVQESFDRFAERIERKIDRIAGARD